MSPHSPAPWRLVIGEQCSSDEASYAILDANGDTVCDNERFYPQAVSPQNQTLIVVAPELLAALIEAEEVFRILAEEGPSHTALEIADRYEALIAKARGEQLCS